MTHVWFAVTRAVHLGALLTALGVWSFDRFLVAPIIRRTSDEIGGIWRRIAARLMLIALSATLLSGIAWFVFVTGGMSGLSFNEAIRWNSLRAILHQSEFGFLWQIRLIFWLAAVGVMIPAFFVVKRLLVYKILAYGGLAAATALVASLAWTGHGITDGSWSRHIFFDALHLLIAGIWPAGLLPLACLLLKIRHSGSASARDALVPLVHRFSFMSLGCAVLMVATGIANSCSLLGSFSSLYSTRYGQVLLIKIVMVCLIIGIGAWNCFYLKPRILGYSADAAPQRFAMAGLQRNVVVELILAGGILIVVGILGLLPPNGYE